MSTAAAMRAYRGPALFTIGLRPFFLFSALWSAIAAPLWVHAYLAGGPATLAWHVHEMLFGYAGGVIVGFLLTAVPNWTGRLPVVGTPLMGLFGLWLAGRIAMAAAVVSPAVAATPWPAAVDALFLLAMAAVVWREVWVGRNWRNLPVAVMVTLLALANIGFHVEAARDGLAATATRLGLAVTAMLIALIGGRITPSFTRNWQVRRGGPMPAPVGRFDGLTLAATAVALIAWTASQALPAAQPAAGGLMLAAGALNLLRLARWRGEATLAEPLVAILHVGYLWLAAGLGLIGASLLAPQAVAPSAGIHALTAGAIGVMTLAVMTRASRGHTGRPLTAGAGGVLIYGLVNSAAVARVAGGLVVSLYQPLLVVSVGLWSAAFLAFVVLYGPMLLTRRPDRQA